MVRQRSFLGHGVGQVRSFRLMTRTDSFRSDEVSGATASRVMESSERKITPYHLVGGAPQSYREELLLRDAK